MQNTAQETIPFREEDATANALTFAEGEKFANLLDVVILWIVYQHFYLIVSFFKAGPIFVINM